MHFCCEDPPLCFSKKEKALSRLPEAGTAAHVFILRTEKHAGRSDQYRHSSERLTAPKTIQPRKLFLPVRIE